MGADYTLHILRTPAEEEDYKVFESNSLGGTWWEYVPYEEHDRRFSELYDKMARTPLCVVGEVSWLKAALFNDSDTFVPDPIGRLSEVIGDAIVVIDDDLIAQAQAALTIPNQTPYQLNDANEVIEFLRQYKGQKVAPISW